MFTVFTGEVRPQIFMPYMHTVTSDRTSQVNKGMSQSSYVARKICRNITIVCRSNFIVYRES